MRTVLYCLACSVVAWLVCRSLSARKADRLNEESQWIVTRLRAVIGPVKKKEEAA